jgi:hypothetical protein
MPIVWALVGAASGALTGGALLYAALFAYVGAAEVLLDVDSSRAAVVMMSIAGLAGFLAASAVAMTIAHTVTRRLGGFPPIAWVTIVAALAVAGYAAVVAVGLINDCTAGWGFPLQHKPFCD